MNALSITESAAHRVSELITSDGTEGSMLRVTVSAGGCSGFSYGFGLDDTQTDEDKIFEDHGIKVVIDEMSLEILGNSEVDFVDDLMGSAFKLNIPNATSSCGCGVSFAV
ncbi:MAG: iron-sulfur cluster insertion protein ErpA [Rhodospirillaceae bacterium]|jgi:iron-sulfur cluster insertion protein|nr:iron-sulfur cluster insertion protein ErpA [Rhodospirillaceae bacterium]MBT5941881.1 iron-sulfur cluster insertion protein ErpA [Rhodospirillaceae bacterium]MBT7265740.1 iron-sulfur cluster insertion protein ErpA [Rhodospirillaceae bacterium]